MDEDAGRLSPQSLSWVGADRTVGELVATGYNLVRMSRLMADDETRVPIGTWSSLGEVCLSDLVDDE